MKQTFNRARNLKYLLIVLALIVAACGSSDSAEIVATEAASDREQGAAGGEFEFGDEAERAAEEPMREPADDALGTGGRGEAVAVVDFGRDIIFTAHLTVAVGDVAAAGTEATNAIQSLGGFVFGQQTVGGGEARTTLVFKIDPPNFQSALTALGSIGEIRAQNVTADDVTEVVVDIQSRISTAVASVERLKGFLTEAGDIDTIAELENQLLNRETTLEVLRGQLRTLQDAVSLATITLTLTEALSNPQMSVQVTSYAGAEDGGASCPGDGGVSVLEDEMVTVCFEIFNTGDTLLTDFALRDAVLDLEIDDLTVVWGELSGNLEPGQSIVLSTGVTLGRSLRTHTRITAVPVNEDGQRVEAREVVNTSAIFLDARDPGGLPGFEDGVEQSWEFLKNLGGIVILVAGLLLPFIWVIALFFLYRWWRRNKLAKLEPPAATEEPEMESTSIE